MPWEPTEQSVTHGVISGYSNSLNQIKMKPSYKNLQKSISRLNYTDSIFVLVGSDVSNKPRRLILVFAPEEPHNHFWSHWILLFKAEDLTHQLVQFREPS